MTVIDSKKFPAVRVGRLRRFLRTFLPWQLVRFLLINIRMSFMILKSHGKANDALKKKE